MDFPKPLLCTEPCRVSKSSDYFVAVGSSNLFAVAICGEGWGTPSANIPGNDRSHKETKSNVFSVYFL